MIKIHGITYETLLEDEQNQIHGFVHVIDSSGLGFNYMTIFTPREAYKIGKNLEVCYRNLLIDSILCDFISQKLLPMRHKEIHGLKVTKMYPNPNYSPYFFSQ